MILITAMILARHIVLSPNQAISCIRRWRTESIGGDRFDSYTRTLVSIYDDDTMPILQYDDRRGMAIIVLRHENGMLRIKNHLSSFNAHEEAQSRSECTLWVQSHTSNF